ncbi:MAG: glycine cleavage system aminomethyltransferase GcvT [Chloroflexota bacterium]|nr:glycine cleavage system aminomethyltransferase GcvT [Chloroflexota bacterium]
MSADSASGASPEQLLRTPLYERHRALGARLVEFSGWEMPVQYSGILDEHRAVRERAGLFDVCHMGEFRVEGPAALDFLQRLVPNNVARLTDGQALYTQILTPEAGVRDDLIIYRDDAEHYLVVVNAGTMPSDWAYFEESGRGIEGLTLTNVSAQTGLLALQGPRAQAILQPLTETPLAEITYYHSRDGVVAGIPCRISRTGYTGEDGFELYCDAAQVGALWDALLAAGQAEGLQPAGLGARDTLRMEAAYCLYGHELTTDITPLEAGLGWTVKLDKGVDFIGRDALVAEKAQGLRRKLIGMELTERNAPRAGHRIFQGGSAVGELTSGGVIPTLGKPIGMGYMSAGDMTPGAEIAIEIRGKLVPAIIVPLPFYKRGR